MMISGKLIHIPLDEGGSVGGIAAGTASVLALLGLGVGLATSLEDSHGVGDVLVLSEPGTQARLLHGTAVGEGQRPRLVAGHLVDVVEGEGGILLGHASREEGDSGHGGRHGVLKDSDSGEGDLLRSGSHGSFRSTAHHVGLEEGSLEEHVVVRESLVASGDDLLGGSSSNLNAEVAVHEHLRLHNGHKAVGLADGGITGEGHGVLIDSELGRGSTDGVLDVENSSPLGEAGTLSVVLGATSIHVINTLGHALAVGAE